MKRLSEAVIKYLSLLFSGSSSTPSRYNLRTRSPSRFPSLPTVSITVYRQDRSSSPLFIAQDRNKDI